MRQQTFLQWLGQLDCLTPRQRCQASAKLNTLPPKHTSGSDTSEATTGSAAIASPKKANLTCRLATGEETIRLCIGVSACHCSGWFPSSPPAHRHIIALQRLQATYQVGGAFGQHDGGRIQVAVRLGREHRGVDHPQAGNATHPQGRATIRGASSFYGRLVITD